MGCRDAGGHVTGIQDDRHTTSYPGSSLGFYQKLETVKKR